MERLRWNGLPLDTIGRRREGRSARVACCLCGCHHAQAPGGGGSRALLAAERRVELGSGSARGCGGHGDRGYRRFSLTNASPPRAVEPSAHNSCGRQSPLPLPLPARPWDRLGGGSGRVDVSLSPRLSAHVSTPLSMPTRPTCEEGRMVQRSVPSKWIWWLTGSALGSRIENSLS